MDLYQNDDLQRTNSQMRSINEDVCLYQRPPSTLKLNVKVILPWMNKGTDLDLKSVHFKDTVVRSSVNSKL